MKRIKIGDHVTLWKYQDPEKESVPGLGIGYLLEPEKFNGLRMALQAHKLYNDEQERKAANRVFWRWGLLLLLLTAAATFGGALWVNATVVGRCL